MSGMLLNVNKLLYSVGRDPMMAQTDPWMVQRVQRVHWLFKQNYEWFTVHLFSLQTLSQCPSVDHRALTGLQVRVEKSWQIINTCEGNQRITGFTCSTGSISCNQWFKWFKISYRFRWFHRIFWLLLFHGRMCSSDYTGCWIWFWPQTGTKSTK